MNVVSLYGRITNDLELKYTQSGKAVLSFSIAVRGYGDNSNFIRCQAWEKRAEMLTKYFHKGSRIGITGQLISGKYESNGQTHYTQDVVVNTVDFVDSKQESAQQRQRADTADAAQQAQAGINAQNPQHNPFENNGKQIDISDADMPF
ncbi:single-stranded DNA-binding protein [Lactiplantibacillus paraplantarum]|uniref:Single-stranded DNA-binding protein n=1 Tax=Lactiplantibacillus paraplantarum TaxID=60520 RepID=A0AAD0TPB9_9LACO|nr:single-stranded DNA-binding protein [Lactiplantibacillus paraplantarum]AYJ38899.1 single-stranded DNA-binding protein [Lactiplantibacillus paraplantarum]AYJ38953.1 single-stranded DNA-binding protein [Lactiplantibacillus paraplantarum]KRL51332.1 hypothetical protein FD48_GL000011 [Lactiplantibacillus paraplantarum DSM 10667]MCU4683995.1 single-stranded DNA-binding protein [Lactiplantibacillus paraplantarum]MDL2061070.1 single-stranded DNA-binding protein [Lactiplantibacillus paraplantarum]